MLKSSSVEQDQNGPDAAAAERGKSAASLGRIAPRRVPVAGAITLLFALTLLLSATLLFLLQPMIAKMVLPLFGGTPAVWNTCMVFFQALLLAGYLYAHLLSRYVPLRQQGWVHTLAVLLPLVFLPFAVEAEGTSPAGASPFLGLLMLLAATGGLPFFVVSTTAPLLQKWFSRTGGFSAKDPYFLYAASNVGSLAALMAYPFLLEPAFRLAEQSQLWSWGYWLFTGLALACVVVTQCCARVEELGKRPAEGDPPPRPDAAPWRWVCLACIPSSLLLGVTTYITTDIASIPLLWVIPLGLYLLTYIVAFSGWSPKIHARVVRLAPLLTLALLFTMISGIRPQIEAAIGLHLLVFTLVALACHGELARTRPPAQRLTAFYLWLSLGGVLGGLINAVVAPLLLVNLLEYPLMLALGGLLLPAVGRQGDDVSFPALLRFTTGLLLSVVAVSFLARGVVNLSLAHADADADALYRHVNAFLSDWTNLCLVNTNGLSAAMGLPVAVVETVLCGLLVAAALLYVFRLPTERTERGLDLWLPLALGVFAVSCVFLSGIGLDNVFRIDGGITSWGELLSRLTAFGPAALLVLLFLHRPVRFALGLTSLLLASTFCEFLSGAVLYRERSFFGVHTISLNPTDGTIQLTHGTTLHGKQFLDPQRRGEALTYYHRTGPIGQVFDAVDAALAMPRVAVVGLGTGTQACYAQSGQSFTFYEIDPTVVRIAENPRYFTFLADARQRGADVKIALGDARLRLAEASDAAYELLVIDAFSSDAIPAHLLTEQAITLYRRKLAPGGLIAFHISNRYLDLAPVLGNLAEHMGLAGLYQRDADSVASGKTGSIWVVLAERPGDFAVLLDRHGAKWQLLAGRAGLSLWTDDFYNLLEIRK